MLLGAFNACAKVKRDKHHKLNYNMLNNDNSNNNNNTTLCCLLSCNIVPHPLATTTTATRTERQTQFSQYTRDMHLCGLLVVQVWLSLSSLIEFHTQNRVSKCLGSKVIWNSGTPPRLSHSLAELSHVSTRALYGIWGVLRMSKLLRSLSVKQRGETSEERSIPYDTKRQRTQVSTPTPAAFLCFTCRWVFSWC